MFYSLQYKNKWYTWNYYNRNDTTTGSDFVCVWYINYPFLLLYIFIFYIVVNYYIQNKIYKTSIISL